SGETCYILVDEQPDTVGAAWRNVERRVNTDKQLPEGIRDTLSMIIRERKALYISPDHGGQQVMGDSATTQYSEGD
ncbi:MAG: hypothetical protein U1E29_18195, partial [Coriobacteriia bacterium]|nr:hypothetical protein [Coriobacteriia bacterium]